VKAMTCSELADLVLDFVGQELDAEQRAEFEQHLCGCPDCVVYVEAYQVTITLTRSLPRCDEGLPPGLEAKLRAALAAEGKS
jgi:anti-sigma factor RsiW